MGHVDSRGFPSVPGRAGASGVPGCELLPGRALSLAHGGAYSTQTAVGPGESRREGRAGLPGLLQGGRPLPTLPVRLLNHPAPQAVGFVWGGVPSPAVRPGVEKAPLPPQSGLLWGRCGEVCPLPQSDLLWGRCGEVSPPPWGSQACCGGGVGRCPLPQSGLLWGLCGEVSPPRQSGLVWRGPPRPCSQACCGGGVGRCPPSPGQSGLLWGRCGEVPPPTVRPAVGEVWGGVPPSLGQSGLVWGRCGKVPPPAVRPLWGLGGEVPPRSQACCGGGVGRCPPSPGQSGLLWGRCGEVPPPTVRPLWGLCGEVPLPHPTPRHQAWFWVLCTSCSTSPPCPATSMTGGEGRPGEVPEAGRRDWKSAWITGLQAAEGRPAAWSDGHVGHAAHEPAGSFLPLLQSHARP
nr:collagen alpha-3(IX) chain-like isoform X2 [Oryctolagus cuniculus]